MLRNQNRAFRGTGGRSQENRGYGFHPAVLDTETGVTRLSCFANGTPGLIHVLEGLPDTAVLRRNAHGRVVEVKSTIITGLRDDHSYTRKEAARALASRKG